MHKVLRHYGELFVHFDERPGAALAVWGINPTLVPSADGRLP